MQRNTYYAATLLMAIAVASTADTKPAETPGTAEAFSRLKSLAGEWRADTEKGKASVTYELIAGGTVLLEREKADGMPDMLTAYHVDRGRLILTHYCMAGNQPRMQAQPYTAASNQIDFQFLDATNMPDPAAGHMHNLKMRFIDATHFVAEWEFYENGKSKMTETVKYSRVK